MRLPVSRAGWRQRPGQARWREPIADLVFTTTIGTPLQPRTVVTQFHALVERAGLRRQRFHDLRHCCATLLLAQGVSLRVIMETLGHNQIGVSMNTYAHVIPALREDATARAGCRPLPSGLPSERRAGRTSLARPARFCLMRCRFPWSRPRDSNPRPAVYETAALPTELGRPVFWGMHAVWRDPRRSDQSPAYLRHTSNTLAKV